MDKPKVIGVTNQFVALEKEPGHIVLIPIVGRKGTLKTDLKNMVRIDIEDGTIGAAYSNGCEVTDF